MAYGYNNYYPAYNAAPVVPQQAPQNQQNDGGIIWVQGEAGAKSYLIGAGKSVILMDSESDRFFIKCTDASGMPMPLRIFEFTEVSPAPQVDMTKYVSREEFDKLAAKLAEMEGVNNGKQSV